MKFQAETKPSDEPIPVAANVVDNPQDFKTAYKDWQAVRIIRDNYFEGWRMFFAFFFWFGALMVGITGYIILNRPFQKEDAYLAGIIGAALILSNLVFAFFMFRHSKRHVDNIRLILDRTGDAEFLAEKVLSNRGAVMMALGASFGLLGGLFAWLYVFFLYYPSRLK